MSTILANEGHLAECLDVRSAWAAWFAQSVPRDKLWCPAAVPIPRLEDEETLRAHLRDPESESWAVAWKDAGRVKGYLLCRSEPAAGRLVLVSQSPRVSEPAEFTAVGGQLISFALSEGARRGLTDAYVWFHGPSAEISPLVELYRGQGFGTEGATPRLEMIRHRSAPVPVAAPIQLRSASRVGLDKFFEADAAIRGCSVDESRGNLECSRRMWVVEPEADWIAAYDNGELVGVLETALTRDGVGVIDYVGVREDCRGKGYGRSLLAHAVAHLTSKTEFIWLDTDRDNAPALRLYKWAGFRVHHEHGSMEYARPGRP